MCIVIRFYPSLSLSIHICLRVYLYSLLKFAYIGLCSWLAHNKMVYFWNFVFSPVYYVAVPSCALLSVIAHLACLLSLLGEHARIYSPGAIIRSSAELSHFVSSFDLGIIFEHGMHVRILRSIISAYDVSQVPPSIPAHFWLVCG